MLCKIFEILSYFFIYNQFYPFYQLETIQTDHIAIVLLRGVVVHPILHDSNSLAQHQIYTSPEIAILFTERYRAGCILFV